MVRSCTRAAARGQHLDVWTFGTFACLMVAVNSNRVDKPPSLSLSLSLCLRHIAVAAAIGPYFTVDFSNQWQALAVEFVCQAVRNSKNLRTPSKKILKKVLKS